MITDVFHKRYPQFRYFGRGFSKETAIFFRQGAQIIFSDLKPHLKDMEEICGKTYAKLVRELGYGLCNGQTAEDICIKAFCEPYDLWNNAHGEQTEFTQYRLSLLELLLAEIENEFTANNDTKSGQRFKLFGKDKSNVNASRYDTFRGAISELNFRFREARMPFHYHNGIIQLSKDDFVEKKIYEPFLKIVKDPKFKNVDIDIKDAIDRRDNRGRDATLYALKALESTIKIISDDKGLTRGSERGAANYIDNLVSSANGRFIDVWEAGALKAMFRDLRNPHGHGPG
ncbi:MAG: hypothetical protein WA151_14175, partial [Desulfatirhabdiaceae bacterium]